MTRTIAEVTKELVKKHGLQPWFNGEPRGRAYAWDVIQYLDREVHKDANILEMGCGIGQNLVELWQHGFRNLCGIEKDEQTFLAAHDLLDQFKVEASLGCWDARHEFGWSEFDVIMPLNFTYQREVDMARLLELVRRHLRTGGLLIIDVISSSLSPEKAPEYVHRFTKKEFVELATGFRLKEVLGEYFPRSVYIMEAI